MGIRCCKIFVTRGQHFSSSTVTSETKVESMSAEWLFQGTSRKGCLFVLVSAAPRMTADFLLQLRQLKCLTLIKLYYIKDVLRVVWKH